jgi:hypothetical protein
MGFLKRKVSEDEIQKRIEGIKTQDTMRLKGYIDVLIKDIGSLGEEKAVVYRGMIEKTLNACGLKTENYL